MSSQSFQNADKLEGIVSVTQFGAVGNGVANDTPAFSSAGSSAATVQVEIPAGVYNLLTNPVVTGDVTWVVHKGASFTGAGTIWSASNKIISLGAFKSIQSSTSFYNGIFRYLEENAAETAYGTIGINAVARTAGGNGGAAEADIGIAGFALNELVGGLGGAWALYGTALRQAGVNGPTHGLELDIANMGNTVPLFPGAMGAAGQTHALWLATGGEVTNVASAGTASVAIGIVRNDSNASPSAAFEKGIVFHNVSIAGCDGATGNGIAIAMASGHQVAWFNNSNQCTSEIVTNNRLVASAQRIDFNEFGILFQGRTNGNINFQVENNASGVNFLSVNSGVAGFGPQLKANGSDANVDVWIQPKGSGVFAVTYGSTPASNPAAFSATRKLAIKDGNGLTLYVPVTTTPW